MKRTKQMLGATSAIALVALSSSPALAAGTSGMEECYPRFKAANARVLQVELEPGDALYRRRAASSHRR